MAQTSPPQTAPAHLGAVSPEPLLLDFAAAAARLGVTQSWLERQATARTVPHRRLGRVIRFSEDDLAAIVAAHAVTPAETAPATPRPTRRRSA
jgi:hypothetical protein